MTSTSPLRERRTQPERVAAMRARLLDACIESLAATGYSAFSTNDVVRRAGVSRGALAHHFPTKAVLVAAATDRLIELRATEFRERFGAIPPAQRTLAEALEVLWTFFDDPSFHALFELTVAARSDAELRPLVAAGSRKVLDVTGEVFGEYFPALARRPFVAPALEGVLALYSGLAAQVAVDRDTDGRHAAVRRMVQAALTLATDAHTPTPPRSDS